MPQADGLAAGETNRAGRVDVVERARERDDSDACTHWTRVTFQSSITVFRQQRLGDGGELVVADGVVDLEFESLTWRTSDTTGMTESGQRPDNGLPLRVENFGLGMTSTTTRATCCSSLWLVSAPGIAPGIQEFTGSPARSRTE